jgi:RNA polymerase sigma-70 factor (ECF subfamily)
MAIPCVLPIPVAGIIPQSAPTVAADSVIDSDGDAVACREAAGVPPAVLALVLLAQAAAVTARAQAITGMVMARPRVRRVSIHRIVLSWGSGRSQKLLVTAAALDCPGENCRASGKREHRRRRITDVGIRDTGPRPVPARAAGQAPGAGLEALLAGVARGDQGAFEAVCTRAGATMFGVVRSVVRDPSQAEEVLQEVLLEVWRAASRFEPGRGSALAWLATIAHRRAIDKVRAEHRLAERQLRAAWYAVDYDEVAETVEARLDRERVRRCLGSLTRLQRESLTLAYYGGYTLREVAALLGVPEGTVKTRMRDGLIRLRDCLGAG